MVKALETNQQDAILIEEHFIEDNLMFEETEVVTQAVGESVLDVAFDGILPVGAAVAAAHHVGNKFETKEERLGYGALAAGGGALLAMTPIGQAAILGYAGYKLFQAGKKVYDGLENAPVAATEQ